MCESSPYRNRRDIYFRNKVPKGKSLLFSDIEESEYPFGLVASIKLGTPEASRMARSLWEYGLFDPFSHNRERYRGQGEFPNSAGRRDRSSFNL